MYSKICALSLYFFLFWTASVPVISGKLPHVKYSVLYTVCFCLFDNQMLIFHIHGEGRDFIQGGLHLETYRETFIHSHHLTTNLTVFNTTTTFLMFVSHINRVQLYDIV